MEQGRGRAGHRGVGERGEGVRGKGGGAGVGVWRLEVG